MAYFEVLFWGHDVPASSKVLVKGDASETLGNVINSKIPDESYIVVDVKASRTNVAESASWTTIETGIPVDAAKDFGYKYLSVQLEKQGMKGSRKLDGGSECKIDTRDVFSVLLAVQKSYTHLPKERPVNHSKDRLYNKVLQYLKSHDIGFTPIQVDTTGKLVASTLTDTLWYLDPHWNKLANRSIYCPDFEDLKGYNQWKSQKIKEPKITTEKLDEKVSAMVSMTSCGYFLNEKFSRFRQMCEKLTDAMIKYSKFLKEQTERSASNREKTEPVRSLNDSNVIRNVQLCSDGDDVDEKYRLVCQSLRLLKDFEPLFLIDYEPVDMYERQKWLVNLKLPFQAKLYCHKFGNYMGNYSFVWKSPEDSENSTGDIDAVTAVKHDLPKFSTRAMRKRFINQYSKVGTKPAILRNMYKFLTDDSSAPENKSQESVDLRVSEFLLQSDSTELIYDMRKNNGRPKDSRLDPFWEALDSHLNKTAIVDERRHGDKLYMPVDISLEDLIDTVAKSLPKDAKIPSKSWVAFNFWPSNPTTRSAMCYTGKFNVKYAVQMRLTRAKHPDSSFAFHQYVLMKEMASNLREECVFICLDDKSIVPVGEPGKPVSTGVRAHNKSLVPTDAKLSALDHDFHIHGTVPSVLFKVEVPEDSSDSFYRGQVHVGVKNKVFSPSSAVRHTAETVKILRMTDSEDESSLTKPRLFVYTDGGPDHRSTYWSVKLAYIAMFVSLDLDMLVSCRTAPSQSYNNPAERCMSLLNISLQNVALERRSMSPGLELMAKSLCSLKKIRTAAERTPDLKTGLIESLEPVLAMLMQRFSKLKLHGEYVHVHDAASGEDIKVIEDCLNIFKDDDNDPPVITCKSLDKAPERLKAFMATHCRARTYSFQIRKCDDGNCWYCLMSPKRDICSELVWLPDPTKGEDGSYLPLVECYGKDTTDDTRPSLEGKAVATEADKRHKSYMTSAQARRFIPCSECGKRRVVYSRQRLTHNQITQILMLEDTVIYVCGSSLFPEGNNLYEDIFVREGLTCHSEIEITYYSAVTQKFPPICFFCGDTDIIGNEAEPMASLLKQYSIVRPLCTTCVKSGKTPAVRNALKVKKK